MTASLHIEVHPTSPPMPIGIGVLVGGKIVASISLDEFREAVKRLEKLEEKYNARR